MIAHIKLQGCGDTTEFGIELENDEWPIGIYIEKVLGEIAAKSKAIAHTICMPTMEVTWK